MGQRRRLSLSKNGKRQYNLIPKAPPGRKIEMSGYLSGGRLLKRWVTHFLPDLDQAEAAKATALFSVELAHPEGKAGRLRYLGKARRAGKALTAVMMALSAWGVFCSSPYRFVMWLLICAPLLAVALANPRCF